ncbi:hypothetical protein D3C87_1980600 [compost metagenome]
MLFLLVNDRRNNIIDRNNTNQLTVAVHGQVADMLVGHDLHTFLDLLVRFNGDDPAGHYVADRRIL